MNLLTPTTECLCLNLLSSYDRMELVRINLLNGEITFQGSIAFEGNATSRTITNPELFEQQLQSLLQSCQATPRLPVYIVLPSLYTRLYSLDAEESYEPHELNGLLVNEAEKFFLFKKAEPTIAWCQAMAPHQLVYTAYPTAEIDLILSTLRGLKYQIESIETNYTSLIKGLAATRAIELELEHDLPWCMLVLCEGVFYIGLLKGEQFEQVLEVPLSKGAQDELQSIEEIQQDFEQFVGLHELSRLVLINNTVTIASERLLQRLGFGNNAILIEQNALTLASLGAQTPLYQCSLEALGSVLSKDIPSLPTLQLLPTEVLENNRFLRLETQALKALALLNIAVILIVGIVWGGLHLYGMTRQFELKRIEQASQTPGSQMPDEAQLRRGLFTKMAMERNIELNNQLVQAVQALPETLWFEKLSIQLADKDTSQFTVTGGALTPEPVNQFLTQMKTTPMSTFKERPLEIATLEFKAVEPGGSTSQQPHYNWVIQAQVPGQTGSAPPLANGGASSASPAAAATSGSSGGPPHG